MDKHASPIIGVTWCSRLDDYVASVEASGGKARVLEIGESPRALLSEIQGLLLTGGGDVDPAFYGEDRHPAVCDAEPGRDEFEIDLARRAMDAGLPVLAICRGSQVLNVADGGTLVQDIPSTIDTTLPHNIEMPKDAAAHDVRVSPGSVLANVLRQDRATQTCRVNSRHHQSVGKLGRRLIAAATAPDGVVEAIEAPDGRFCLGVQWHPENFWRTGEFKPLFDAFVEAARERMAARRQADDEDAEPSPDDGRE
jgi:putative glutamine amidotransferase